MNDYSDLVIVAEEAFYSQKKERATVRVYNTLWQIKEILDEGDNNGSINRVVFQKSSSDKELCHAEVLFVHSDALKPVRKVRQKFKAGDFAEDEEYYHQDNYHNLVIIRILEKKQNFVNKFDLRSAADVTFVVNDEECKGDRKYLAAVSPVFNKMLNGQFVESQQDRFVLEEIESAEIFKDLLLAISSLRIQPNPANVAALLKLADRYDIPFLMRICEDRLINSYEIPIVERILLAGKYRLEALKLHIQQTLNLVGLQKLFKNQYNQLEELDSKFDFLSIKDSLQ